MTSTFRGLTQGSQGYIVNEICYHCSATRPDWLRGSASEEVILANQFKEIKRWHMTDNGWRNIGYHYVIGRSGLIMPGRKENEIGAGILGHNRGVIHICLIGGHGSDANDKAETHFTEQQLKSLNRLTKEIMSRAAIRFITGHNQYASKACPGFRVRGYLASLGADAPRLTT